MPDFVYRALTVDERRIRLIHLLPKRALARFGTSLAGSLSNASASDPQIRVKCTISHVSLDRRPAYVVLSYAWGDTSQKAPILVNEARFYVTRSLEVALTHLTPEHEHARCVQFVCGYVAVSEEPFYYATRLLRNFGQYQQSKPAQHPQLMHSGTVWAALHVRNPVSFLTIRRAAKSYPLIYLIRTFRYCHATDPRDKIFALLSFVADTTALGLRPDYSKSCREIYRDVTTSLLKNKFWDILSLCEVHEADTEALS